MIFLYHIYSDGQSNWVWIPHATHILHSNVWNISLSCVSGVGAASLSIVLAQISGLCYRLGFLAHTAHWTTDIDNHLFVTSMLILLFSQTRIVRQLNETSFVIGVAKKIILQMAITFIFTLVVRQQAKRTFCTHVVICEQFGPCKYVYQMLHYMLEK